jgi:hypothetical protein
MQDNQTKGDTRFPMGRLVITAAAEETVPAAIVAECVARHSAGDWGVVSDPEENKEALRTGGRLLSAYPIDPALPCRGHGENTLWIITEADRSSTTVLLPDDY